MSNVRNWPGPAVVRASVQPVKSSAETDISVPVLVQMALKALQKQAEKKLSTTKKKTPPTSTAVTTPSVVVESSGGSMS